MSPKEVEMGTWAAGPFGNDTAADYVGEWMDGLMQPIEEFLSSPEIDETFDGAFAAMAVLNAIMALSPSRPWDRVAKSVRAPGPIVTALLACYDEQIDGMQPDPAFKIEQRAALVAECERFTAFLDRT